MQRTFDVLAAMCGFFVLARLLAAVCACVILGDGRPVLFWRVRAGRGGRDFRLCKLRTMAVLRSAAQGRFDVGSAARVTPVGRFLRGVRDFVVRHRHPDSHFGRTDSMIGKGVARHPYGSCEL